MELKIYEIKQIMDDIFHKHYKGTQGGDNWDGALNIYYHDLLNAVKKAGDDKLNEMAEDLKES